MTTPDIRLVQTDRLTADERRAVRALLDTAFGGDFTDDDWEHALSGWHALMEVGDAIVAHGSVVPRTLQVGDRAFHAGYVEAVAVTPSRQRAGLGTDIMRTLTDLTHREFELGALSTGEWGFYERLGWQRWRGATWVRSSDGRLTRTADDDDGVMVLRCAASREIDPGADITCEERPGDSW
jgi:aminoglycoside 2'-N-acetyltransferase I